MLSLICWSVNFWKKRMLICSVTFNLVPRSVCPWPGLWPPTWLSPGLERDQRLGKTLKTLGRDSAAALTWPPTSSKAEGEATTDPCSFKFKLRISSFITEWWSKAWLVLGWELFPVDLPGSELWDQLTTIGVPWVRGSCSVLPGQFKPRSHLLQPLHKQSVGRSTPEVSDLVEEGKQEKSETHFGFPKPYLGFWLDMSVSPPSASPLERVQTTRARFVRAKPDPVLRSWRDSASIESVWLFRTNKRES